MAAERFFPLIENPAGAAFSRDTHRFAVVAAGRRSGKTERAKRKTLVRSLLGVSHTYGPARYAMCAPTYGQAKAIFWDDLKAMTAAIRHGHKGGVSESGLWVALGNGAEIHVVGLDAPQRVEGSPWDGFAIDEVDDLKPGFWEEHLRPCLSDRNGWALLFGVPNGFGRLYDFSLLANTDPDWAYFAWPSREVLPATEIEAAMRTMDARTFRQEYEASFETCSGRVYYAFDRALSVRPVPAAAATSPLWVGMDFNVDPLSAVIGVEVGTDSWVIDSIEIRGSSTHEMVAEIRQRYGARATTAYPDPTGRARKTSAAAGQTDHEILRQAGFKVNSRLTSIVRDGINSVNARFCSASGARHLFVDPKAKRLIEALERHAYKEGSSQPAQDGHDHMCDALRYAIEYQHPIKQRAEWAQ